MGKAMHDCADCKATFKTKRRLANHTCHNMVQIKEEPIDIEEEESSMVIKLEPTDFIASNLESFGNIDSNNGEALEKYKISGEEDPLNVEVKEEIISDVEMTVEKETLPVPVENQYLPNGKHIKCKECNKIFKNQEIFNSHTKSAHNTFKPYSCSVCNKKFLQKHYVNLHMRVHTGERPYACPLCPNTYSHKTSYTIHMRIHNGVRPYTCEVCGKKCYDKSGLTSHMRSHTKETPYTCEICGRRFSHSKSLLVHKRNHTGEKPYICKYCGKAFRHWHKHKIHIRLHTGERPYRCKICDKGFPRNDEVKRHMRSHTGIKSFRCALCDVYCATQVSITGHINLHHSINVRKALDAINDPPTTQVPPNNKPIEDPSSTLLYNHLTQQGTYVADILMKTAASQLKSITAIRKNLEVNQNKEKITIPREAETVNGKQKDPLTKVINITTSDPPPIKRKNSFFRSLGFRDPVDLNIRKADRTGFTSKSFKEWQQLMLDKQGLVVKGLPTLYDEYSSNLPETCFGETQKSVANDPTIIQDTPQTFLLLSNSGQLLLPSNNAPSTKINIATNNQPNNKTLIVPGRVAVQPMFCLGSNRMPKMLLLPDQQRLLLANQQDSMSAVNNEITEGGPLFIKSEVVE